MSAYLKRLKALVTKTEAAYHAADKAYQAACKRRGAATYLATREYKFAMAKMKDKKKLPL